MRLLLRSDTGKFKFTKEYVGDDAIPPYAILSHTWGKDAEEVTFEDLVNGTGENKSGYRKIQFCGQQAAQDNLEYFWIDTCCINKTNYAELSRAINSMFRWYHNAVQCYVLLSDVSSSSSDVSDALNPQEWDSAFRKSKWFTRGWTLQELLAPMSVEFFSQEWKRLGDKKSLEQEIHEITGISKSALQGTMLSQFSINERMSWIERRQTKLAEDKAYSLLGIFDVYIPLIYGEGIGSAFKRLQKEMDKLKSCIQDLRLTDPRDDKKRIEDTKGGLLEDSYHWILETYEFQQWQRAQQSPLLWVKGDPGKGKTMLLCGIVNELSKSKDMRALLAYFFCQATDSRINTATAVLRGLVYLLVDQQPSLISHIQKKHDHAGKTLFEDANAWTALSEIFTSILHDENLKSTYLVIDALDECITGLPKLLDLIVQSSSSPRIKWIVSSRNWPEIEEQLERAGHKVRLCLELNAESIAIAVDIFIQHKVRELVERKKYDDKTRDGVLSHLSLHANDTFLWVALVCQNLEKVPRWKALAKLDVFPPGLDSLYKRMIEQICALEDTDLCKRILATIAIVHRPITLDELTALVEMLDDMADDLESVREIIGLCGSFLTIRESTIYFVHQSAKDFLFAKAFSTIFPSGREDIHYEISSRSLQVMSRTLQRDMYGLRTLGFPAMHVEQPDPDPLAALPYSCVYWIDHLCDCADRWIDLKDGDVLDKFLREQYLFWLEALSLFKSMSEGVVSMARLEALIHVRIALLMYSIYNAC
jgi:hypothetical protein